MKSRSDLKELVKLIAKYCSQNTGFKFADVARPDLGETRGINLKVKELLSAVFKTTQLNKLDVCGYTILYDDVNSQFALYFGMFQRGDNRLFNMHRVRASKDLGEIIGLIDRVVKGEATDEEVRQLVPF